MAIPPLGVLVTLATLGCSSSPTSPTWPGAPSTATGAAPSRNTSVNRTLSTPDAAATIALGPQLLASLVPATDQPYPSQGHDPPEHLIQVWVSPAFRETYRSWSANSTVPEGTWIVARHQARAAPSSNLPSPDGLSNHLYYIRRDSAGTHFGVAGAKGHALPFAREVCQNCHSQAPWGDLFGLPRSLQK